MGEQSFYVLLCTVVRNMQYSMISNDTSIMGHTDFADLEYHVYGLPDEADQTNLMIDQIASTVCKGTDLPKMFNK